MSLERLNHCLAGLAARVDARLRQVVQLPPPPFTPLGAMQAYHLGWYGADLRPLEQPEASGKRLRSALCLLSCQAVSGSTEPALGVAAAIELVHNFSLVHDDIQDESPMRRHRPTVWALWGSGQAINVGDALYTAALLAITTESALSAQQRVEALRLLGEACLRLVEGQYLDLALQGSTPAGFVEYEAMVERKTAALIAASAELGALCGNADAETRALYRRFGRALGLAFQYQDDLLGVWGDERITGKSAAADIRSGKQGLPAVLAFQHADSAQVEELRRYYALPTRDPAAAAAILERFERIGVRQQAERLIAERYREALEWLTRAPGDASTKQLLVALLESLRTRAA